jgi:hypothetical protein
LPMPVFHFRFRFLLNIFADSFHASLRYFSDIYQIS